MDDLAHPHCPDCGVVLRDHPRGFVCPSCGFLEDQSEVMDSVVIPEDFNGPTLHGG